MSKAHLVIVDLETGGVEEHHPDIQVAAVAVDVDWQEVDHFESKIRFDESQADPEALRINSYSAEVWKAEGLSQVDVVDALYRFLSNHASMRKVSKRTGRPYWVARLAGHNIVRFDGPRLERLFKRHTQFLPADIYRPLDTMQRALWWFTEHPDEPQPDDFQLGTLCDRFGIETVGAHDALADVRMTARLAAFLCRGSDAAR